MKFEQFINETTFNDAVSLASEFHDIRIGIQNNKLSDKEIDNRIKSLEKNLLAFHKANGKTSIPDVDIKQLDQLKSREFGKTPKTSNKSNKQTVFSSDHLNNTKKTNNLPHVSR